MESIIYYVLWAISDYERSYCGSFPTLEAARESKLFHEELEVRIKGNMFVYGDQYIIEEYVGHQDGEFSFKFLMKEVS